MDRRQFLGRTTVSLAGLAAGGIAMGAGELGRATRERDDTALPGGPGRELGCRQLIWSVPTAEPLAALTFDDGPDPELTPRILAVLACYDVRATFNVMGYNAVRHCDLIRALVDGGHELGNHTWSHQDLAFQSPTATGRQLDRGLAAIERTAGVRPRFFRPPRGELTGAAVQAAPGSATTSCCGRWRGGRPGWGHPARWLTISLEPCARGTWSCSTTASAGAPSTPGRRRAASSGPGVRSRWPRSQPRSSGF